MGRPCFEVSLTGGIGVTSVDLLVDVRDMRDLGREFVGRNAVGEGSSGVETTRSSSGTGYSLGRPHQRLFLEDSYGE
jgi:hypothetical protein